MRRSAGWHIQEYRGPVDRQPPTQAIGFAPTLATGCRKTLLSQVIDLIRISSLSEVVKRHTASAQAIYTWGAVSALRRDGRRKKTDPDYVKENIDFLTLGKIMKCPK